MATIVPIHPGEVLLEEFLEPLGVTQHRLAVSRRTSRSGDGRHPRAWPWDGVPPMDMPCRAAAARSSGSAAPASTSSAVSSSCSRLARVPRAT